MNHLPTPPVSSVNIGSSKARYCTQHNGVLHSVVSKYMSAASQQQPNEFYMASVGKFYHK